VVLSSLRETLVPSGVRKNTKRCGARGWEIYDKKTGKHVGCSSSKKKAHIAASMRDRGHKEKAGG
jgi:hypothetical protein